MGEHFEKFKKRREHTVKSLKEIECFLRNFTVVKKGKKVYDAFKK